MATCATGGQAVGIAAALCRELGLSPRDLSTGVRLRELQLRLDRRGQFLPGRKVVDPADLAATASVSASSELKLGAINPGNDLLKLDSGWAMLLPLVPGPCPVLAFDLVAESATSLTVKLRRANKPDNFTPDETLETLEVSVPAGESRPEIRFQNRIDRTGYHFIQLCENPLVSVRLSEQRITGIVSATNAFNKAVAKSSVQSPPDGIGIDTFEFWLPKRRPAGKNLALTIQPPLKGFAPGNVTHGPARPTTAVNAWVADPADAKPELSLAWAEAGQHPSCGP